MITTVRSIYRYNKEQKCFTAEISQSIDRVLDYKPPELSFTSMILAGELDRRYTYIWQLVVQQDTDAFIFAPGDDVEKLVLEDGFEVPPSAGIYVMETGPLEASISFFRNFGAQIGPRIEFNSFTANEIHFQNYYTRRYPITRQYKKPILPPIASFIY